MIRLNSNGMVITLNLSIITDIIIIIDNIIIDFINKFSRFQVEMVSNDSDMVNNDTVMMTQNSSTGILYMLRAVGRSALRITEGVAVVVAGTYAMRELDKHWSGKDKAKNTTQTQETSGSQSGSTNIEQYNPNAQITNTTGSGKGPGGISNSLVSSSPQKPHEPSLIDEFYNAFSNNTNISNNVNSKGLLQTLTDYFWTVIYSFEDAFKIVNPNSDNIYIALSSMNFIVALILVILMYVNILRHYRVYVTSFLLNLEFIKSNKYLYKLVQMMHKVNLWDKKIFSPFNGFSVAIVSVLLLIMCAVTLSIVSR